MPILKPLLLATCLFCATATLSPVFAAGESAEPAASAGATTALSAKALGCKRGEVGKTTDGKQACTTLAAGTLPDDQLYEQGRLLATEGEYDWALEALSLITKQDDPKVLNYIGYSNRKAGRLETGIAAYMKALALDPNYVKAREYLGEAYITAGKLDLAKVELAEIKTRCGETCPEFVALDKSLKALTN